VREESKGSNQTWRHDPAQADYGRSWAAYGRGRNLWETRDWAAGTDITRYTPAHVEMGLSPGAERRRGSSPLSRTVSESPAPTKEKHPKTR